MNTTSSTTTVIPRRGRLKYGPIQYSEGWPLLFAPLREGDGNPWISPTVDRHLECWPTIVVEEPAVQGATPQQRELLDECYRRDLDVAVTGYLGAELTVWEVTCPNHHFHSATAFSRTIRVYVGQDGDIDTVQVCDPYQADDALATVTIDPEDVPVWLDNLHEQVVLR